MISHLEVDKTKFHVNATQGPPRVMTSEKETHMKKFIGEGLAPKVIRPSNLAYYSQVHLVPKPSEENVKNNGEATPTTPRTWRTIIDYKKFNKCITTHNSDLTQYITKNI